MRAISRMKTIVDALQSKKPDVWSLSVIIYHTKQLISISFLFKQSLAIKQVLFDKDESQVLDD